MNQFLEPLEPRRLLAGYILDRRFDGDGVIDTRDAALGEAMPTQTLVDRAGRLVVVTPYLPAGGGNKQLAIRRYRTDGAIDTTLDSDGKLVIDLGFVGVADPLVTLLHDNSLIVALRQGRKPLLQRYTTAGRLDPAFAQSADSDYKNFPTFDVSFRSERLFTDAQGRVVFMQHITQGGPETFGNSLPEQEVIRVRASRYLSTGAPDPTFGTRGGLDITHQVESPSSYRFEGKYFNRRFAMQFTEPQIDSADNVIIGGNRQYARGSAGGSALDLTQLFFPFVYSFNRRAQVNRRLIVGLDPAQARFEGLKLRYTGLQVLARQSVLTPDDTFYVAGGNRQRFNEQGLAVFQPSGDTFQVVGSQPTFPAAQLHVFGNQPWALLGGRGGLDRLAAVNRDGTVGETMGMMSSFLEGITFNVIAGDRPQQMYGFEDFRKLDVRRTYLTLQEGTTTLAADGTLRVSGTAGEDYITIERRSTGRYVVTGAGRTRSFAQAEVQRLSFDSAGGNDSIELPFGLELPSTFIGSSGDDSIYGGHGDDLIIGGSGDDSLHGDNGDDTVRGESGNDRVEGNGGLDHLFGGSGNDNSFFLEGATYVDIEEIT